MAFPNSVRQSNRFRGFDSQGNVLLYHETTIEYNNASEYRVFWSNAPTPPPPYQLPPSMMLEIPFNTIYPRCPLTITRASLRPSSPNSNASHNASNAAGYPSQSRLRLSSSETPPNSPPSPKDHFPTTTNHSPLASIPTYAPIPQPVITQPQPRPFLHRPDLHHLSDPAACANVQNSIASLATVAEHLLAQKAWPHPRLVNYCGVVEHYFSEHFGRIVGLAFETPVVGRFGAESGQGRVGEDGRGSEGGQDRGGDQGRGENQGRGVRRERHGSVKTLVGWIHERRDLPVERIVADLKEAVGWLHAKGVVLDGEVVGLGNVYVDRVKSWGEEGQVVEEVRFRLLVPFSAKLVEPEKMEEEMRRDVIEVEALGRFLAARQVVCNRVKNWRFEVGWQERKTRVDKEGKSLARVEKERYGRKYWNQGARVEKRRG
ncbi:hypothetical protein C1H76_0406 [Elsinoe australis]|uniref:Uncharacterized protein n=1 Tax=Elsinoe australis TaxID=40998 RepID=A0A4U7B7W4_9PEZI|nr:hypothetical protein C1H76_0406 [Elsinoe australis]